MTAWQDIVAIFDAAGPLQLVFDGDDPVAAGNGAEASEASNTQKDRAPPARRRGRSSLPAGAAQNSQRAGAAPPPAAFLPAGEDFCVQPSHAGEMADDLAYATDGGDDARRCSREQEEEIQRAALNRELADLPMTDLGNAERFRRRFGHLFKWCPELGWLAWDERRWARKGADERVRIAVHETVRAIQDEAQACFDEAAGIADDVGAEAIEQAKPRKKPAAEDGRKRRRKKPPPDEPLPLDARTLAKIGKHKRLLALGMQLVDWGLDSEMNAKIGPVEKHAAPYLAVDIEKFDADPWKFNVANGTLVFDRTADGYVRFTPHDPADLITKISPAEYHPEAACPRFDAFFERVQPRAGERRFLLAWGGYSLTGDASAQQLVMLHGEGRNGKGALIRIFAHVCGDYAKATPIETFLAEGSPRNASQPTPERAALPGVRMLYTNEPKKGSLLDEAFIKLVTGGDRISARDLNKSQFEFDPVFKLLISGNHKPKINDQTESIWARMNLVPWGVIVPKEERDLKLDEKLRAEASGVLNRMLDGLRDWMDNGLVRSDAIEKATAEYRRESDQLGRFLEDCTERHPDAAEQSTLLYNLFVAWARANGASEWKHAGFTRAMTDRGFATFKSNVMFFAGLRATKQVSDFVDSDGKPLVVTTPTRVSGSAAAADTLAGADYEVPF